MPVQNGGKAMARTLREALKAKNIDLGHGECLELVAKTFGFASWNVMSAQTSTRHQPSDTAACAFCGRTNEETQRLFAGPTSFICQDCAIHYAETAEHREVMDRLDHRADLEAYLGGKTLEQLERVIAIAGRRLAEKRIAITHLDALAGGTLRADVHLADGMESIRWEILAKRTRVDVAALGDHQRGELALTQSAIDAATLVLRKKFGSK